MTIWPHSGYNLYSTSMHCGCTVGTTSTVRQCGCSLVTIPRVHPSDCTVGTTSSVRLHGCTVSITFTMRPCGCTLGTNPMCRVSISPYSGPMDATYNSIWLRSGYKYIYIASTWLHSVYNLSTNKFTLIFRVLFMK